VPQLPQLATVLMLVSQPSTRLLVPGKVAALQSRKPLAHMPPSQEPAAHDGAMWLFEQGIAQPPQLATLVFGSTQVPLQTI
jgi:hypothetical protein